MSNLKDKLKEIQTVAASLPDKIAFAPKGKYTGSGDTPKPTGGGGSKFSPSGGGGGFSAPTGGANDIRKMQKAIQDFAGKVAMYKPVPKMDKGKIIYQISDEDKKRRDFNDFLTEQFAASADIHGDEYSPIPTDTSKASKLPTDLVQLSVVLDGLKRIGPAGNEKMRDGVWDFRTNNAVRNTYAVAAALVAAFQALGGMAANSPSTFRSADLQALRNAIPKEKDPMEAGKSQKDLAQAANAITPLVNKLSDFYEVYSKKVMDHPAYTRYIKGDVPLFTVKPGGDNPYKPDQNDPSQVEAMKNPKGYRIPWMTLTTKDGSKKQFNGQITLDYLSSRDGLQSLMQQYLGYSPSEINNGPLMRKIVNEMLTNINSFLVQNKPLPKPPAETKVLPAVGGPPPKSGLA